MCKIVLKNAKIFTVSVAVHNPVILFIRLFYRTHIYAATNEFPRKVTFKGIVHLDSWLSKET